MFRNRKKLAEYTSILMNLKFIYQETLRKDRKLAAAFIFKALLQVASTPVSYTHLSHKRTKCPAQRKKRRNHGEGCQNAGDVWRSLWR